MVREQFGQPLGAKIYPLAPLSNFSDKPTSRSSRRKHTGRVVWIYRFVDRRMGLAFPGLVRGMPRALAAPAQPTSTPPKRPSTCLTREQPVCGHPGF